jgi:hypothetical protein
MPARLLQSKPAQVDELYNLKEFKFSKDWCKVEDLAHLHRSRQCPQLRALSRPGCHNLDLPHDASESLSSWIAGLGAVGRGDTLLVIYRFPLSLTVQLRPVIPLLSFHLSRFKIPILYMDH